MFCTYIVFGWPHVFVRAYRKWATSMGRQCLMYGAGVAWWRRWWRTDIKRSSANPRATMWAWITWKRDYWIVMCVETVPHFSFLLFLQLVTCPNASFTDLAEIVSRIEPVKPALVDGKSMLNLINLPFKSTFSSWFLGFLAWIPSILICFWLLLSWMSFSVVWFVY